MELLRTDPKNTLALLATAPPKRRGVSLVFYGLSCAAFLTAGGAGGFYAALRLFVATPVAETTETIVKPAESKSIDQALELIRTARVRFKDVKDYQCLYLRDEVIDGQMQMNTMLLKIRHQPFSVGMEWLGPAVKKGRRVVYVTGKNDNKMLVKQLLLLKMDPLDSIKKKESRHTIQEAGILNLINRYEAAWERERTLHQTKITVEEKVESITLSEKTYTRQCQVVTSTHPPDSQNTFEFYMAKVYFDKETGLPIRTECYDFPTKVHPEGRLVERYTYLDLRMNQGLTDADFTIK